MRFLSVCSGIEAASVAWNPLGWEACAFSEIEPFPCALLAHYHPHVPNHGDMLGFADWPDHAVDLLCGGTPCQSFSHAGERAGMDDPRGLLTMAFGDVAARYRPRWLVWENVPGILSSDGGRDFGAFLGLLGRLGYGFAYRVLDAQYFGLAQRRRRVFVVGCLGDWHAAAAVLIERQCLSGHPAPSRAPRTDPAGKPDAGADGDRVIGSLTSSCGPNGHGFADFTSHQSVESGHLLAFGGNDTRGPIEVATALNACTSASGRMDFESETFIAFDTTQITSRTNRCRPEPGDPCHPLAASAHVPAIAFPGVRRLIPRECERLMGFPDNYTLIRFRGKPAADGPRYRALGNSWAVPVVRWIGERIEAVEQITSTKILEPEAA